MIYVLDKNGKPLMPTEKHGKVRHLLKDGKAKVVKSKPFTIQLLYDSNNYIQPISVGMDAGSKTIGLSATTENKELYSANIHLRTDIVDGISSRAEMRRTRRNRNTRYRPARFNNRKRADKWLAPSINSKIQVHQNSIENITKILPVSKITVETAAFDTQLLKATEAGLPAPEGIDYQMGEQYGFWNVREYVLFRDGHSCQCCHGKAKSTDTPEIKEKRKILNVHHIESRKTGGDAPNNLITLCEWCHHEYHAGKLTIDNKLIKFVRGSKFNDAAFMGIMRWAFYNKLKEWCQDNNIECHMTYGFITKNTRIQNHLPKEHYIDARCISGNPTAEPFGTYYDMMKLKRHFRQLQKAQPIKGGRIVSAKSPYEIQGIRANDVVHYFGNDYFIASRQTAGAVTLRQMNGSLISPKNPIIKPNGEKCVSYPRGKNLTVVRHSNGLRIAELPQIK